MAMPRCYDGVWGAEIYLRVNKASIVYLSPHLNTGAGERFPELSWGTGFPEDSL